MKIGFVVNDVMTESPVYTTTRLAMQATNMGHDVWLMGMGDFSYEPDGSLSAQAHGAADKNYRSHERYLADIQEPKSDELLSLSEFDMVMLRSDPADDHNEAPWANNAGWRSGSSSPRRACWWSTTPAASPMPCPRRISSTSRKWCARTRPTACSGSGWTSWATSSWRSTCSARALGSSAALYDQSFSVTIIEDLERKVSISAHYPNKLTNLDLAAL